MIYHELTPFRVTESPCIFAIGTFDGVHIGHQAFFQHMDSDAKTKGCRKALVVLQNHPRKILGHGMPLELTPDEEKIELISKFHFDILIHIPFTPEIARLVAAQFVEKIVAMIPIRSWWASRDIAFGAGRTGTCEFLEKVGPSCGFDVAVVEKVHIDGAPVSSSRIRDLIASGQYDEAEKLLGRPYKR